MTKPLRDWPAAKLEAAAQRSADTLKGAQGRRAAALRGWITRYTALRYRKVQKGLPI